MNTVPNNLPSTQLNAAQTPTTCFIRPFVVRQPGSSAHHHRHHAPNHAQQPRIEYGQGVARSRGCTHAAVVQPQHPTAGVLPQPQPQQPITPPPSAAAAAAAATTPQQAPIRPAHAQQHVQHMSKLVRSCDSVLKLQAVLSIHLHQFTPSCIATAMQQLAMLRQREQKQQQQSATSSSARADLGPVLQAVQLQLAGQLTQALLKQLPVVSGSCLASFLVAASAMRLAVPGHVLEQLAAHLVHKALRLACEEQQQQHQQQQGTDTTATTVAAAETCSTAGSTTQSQPQPQQLPKQRHERQHVAAVSAWALAKLRLQSAPLWSELCSIAGEAVPHMSPHDCVLLAYALAKARQPQPWLFHALQQQLAPHAAQLSPDSISCLLWSYAAAGEYHHAWVSSLVAAATDKMERFSPRQLATSLWACGKLRHADARMLSALRVQALACMPDMQAHSLCSLAWSLATLGVSDEALTQAVVSRAQQLVDGLSMQGLANMAWAVVKLQQQLKSSAAQPRHHHRAAVASSVLLRDPRAQQQGGQSGVLQSAHELLAAICTAAERRLGAAKPQEVCNLLWACATLKHRHKPFFEAAAVRLAAVAEDAQPIDLSQALWALNTLRFHRSSTQQTLLLSALRRLHTFGPQALSNLAWAVASSGMRYDPSLPAAVAQQLQALLPHMTPQGLATTLWALSKMRHTPQQLVHAASSHIRQQLPLFNAQDLCNVAMVVAKAGYREPQLLEALAAAASNAAAVSLGRTSSSQAAAAAAFGGQLLGLSGGLDGLGELPLSGGLVQQQQQHKHSKHSQRLTWQGVCNLVWAFAGVGWCDSVLLQQLQELAVLHLPRLQPSNIAALCQGFALLGEPLDTLLAALPAALSASQHSRERRWRDHNSMDSKHLLHSATHTSLPQPQRQQEQHQQPAAPPQAQLSDVQVLVEQLRSWPADSLALLLQAVAVTGAQDSCPALVLAVLKLLNSNRGSSAAAGADDALSPRRLSQLHLALTRIALEWGVLAPAAPADHKQGHGGDAVAATTHTLSPPVIPSAVSHQHHQHDQQQQGGGGGGGGSSQQAVQALAAGLLTGRLAQRCLHSWQQEEADRQLSRVEQEVAAALQGMGLQPLLLHWLPLSTQQPHTHAAQQRTSRALAVRLALPARVVGGSRSAGPVALCVLAPAALSSSWPRKVLGHTVLEHSCLQSAGWQVVCLSWEVWDRLAGDVGQQRRLLEQLLLQEQL